MGTHVNNRKRKGDERDAAVGSSEAERIRSFVRASDPNGVDENDLEAVISMILAIQIPYEQLRDQGKTVTRQAPTGVFFESIGNRAITEYDVDCPLIFKFSCQQLQAGSKRRITSLYLDLLCVFDEKGKQLPKGHRGHYLKHVAKLDHLQDLVLKTWEPGLSLTKILSWFPNLTSLNFQFRENGSDTNELVLGSLDLIRGKQSKLEKLRVGSRNSNHEHLSKILLEVLPHLPNLWSLTFESDAFVRFWDVAKTIQDHTSKVDPNSRLRVVTIDAIVANIDEYTLTTRYRTEMRAESTQTSLKSMGRAFKELETFDAYGFPVEIHA